MKSVKRSGFEGNKLICSLWGPRLPAFLTNHMNALLTIASLKGKQCLKWDTEVKNHQGEKLVIWALVNMGKCKQRFEMDGKDDLIFQKVRSKLHE